MEIKKDLEVSTTDFWYDLVDGGYIKPEEILINTEDIRKVEEAITVLLDFQNSLEEQVEPLLEKYGYVENVPEVT